MKITHLTLSTLVALLGLLCALPAGARESRDADPDGDLEHFHHEAYSHSYVDPGNQDEPGSGDISKAAPRKHQRHDGRTDTRTSIAFGGHPRDRHGKGSAKEAGK